MLWRFEISFQFYAKFDQCLESSIQFFISKRKLSYLWLLDVGIIFLPPRWVIQDPRFLINWNRGKRPISKNALHILAEFHSPSGRLFFVVVFVECFVPRAACIVLFRQNQRRKCNHTFQSTETEEIGIKKPAPSARRRVITSWWEASGHKAGRS